MIAGLERQRFPSRDGGFRGERRALCAGAQIGAGPFAARRAQRAEFAFRADATRRGAGHRGGDPGWFRRLLDRYEMRDLPEQEVATGIPIASGCFKLARRSVLQAIGGFSPAYFLYFEYFDLSLRLRRMADIAYVPQVRILHRGGYAVRKGWTHRRLCLRSAVTFFRRHGWKLC